jgi:hypothetical protein
VLYRGLFVGKGFFGGRRSDKLFSWVGGGYFGRYRLRILGREV